MAEKRTNLQKKKNKKKYMYDFLHRRDDFFLYRLEKLECTYKDVLLRKNYRSELNGHC